MKNKKGKVGAFFYINENIYSDSVKIDEAELYGNFKTWGSHYEFWDVLSENNEKLKYLDYNYYPRGRVTYNYIKDEYYIYLNSKLNNQAILEKISEEFNLSDKNYIIDDKDEHYQE